MKSFVVSLVGCLAVCSLVVGLALLPGCGKSEPPPVVTAPPPPAPAPEPPPPPPPIQLATLNPVTITPGQQAAVDMNVTRNGREGAITVQVAGAPEGLTAKAASLAADASTGKLELTADQKLGDAEIVADLSVTVTVGDSKDTKPVRVTIPKLNLPRFLPAAELLLQPGVSQTVEVGVERNGFTGPLEVQVAGLPAQVTCKAAPVTAEQNALRLEVAAAPGAANGAHKANVSTVLFGRTISVEVPVKIETRPFQVKAFQVLTIQPGQTQRVQVPVERGSYQGILQLKAEDLPPGVTIRTVDVAADQKTTTLEITAAADAVPRVKSARVASLAGSLSGNDPIVIRISNNDDTYLPPGLTANAEIGPLLRRGSIGGRLTPESKQALLDFYGGTPESEAAVLRGLRWLAAHQQADGSWLLKNYSQSIRNCSCMTDFEKELDDDTTASTALGVLPFLGAGITHNRAPRQPVELAKYQDVVLRALRFLAQKQTRSKDKNDGYLGGSMYAHTAGTIAFCEAYGLSGDETLKGHAQLALKYLLQAQHAQGGGWRYSSGQAGDMSVTGWVIMAIRSAQLAGISVLPESLNRATRFLDSCSVGPPEAKKSRYCYTPGTAEKLALSAAGLLTRQYLGWRNDEADLKAGCEYLMKNLPPESGTALGQIYFYYYATQVLHHMEGPNFDLWNHRMREHLIRTQETSGHADGSWNPQGTDYGNRGGRVYATSMAVITLEVYYRHLPLYRNVKRTGSATPAE